MNADGASEALAKFRIPCELLEVAGVRHAADAEVRELLGIHGRAGQDLTGIVFPYPDPRDGRVLGHRVRLDRPFDGQKYLSTQGCRALFFAPAPASYLNDTSIPIVFVEAEKSALALMALASRQGHKLLAVAAGGVWGWKRKVGSALQPNGTHKPVTGPSPSLDWIALKDRKAFIIFDSNVRGRRDLEKARHNFAEELARRGAQVFIASVPGRNGVNGPDDLIAIDGDEAALEMLDRAGAFTPRPQTGFEWPEPSQFGDELPPVQSFAPELLPKSFLRLVEDVADRMQTPMDYAAASVIVALAGSVNRRAVIQPKAEDTSWVVVPNLWGAVIAPPGLMKSPVQRQMTLPLRRIEEMWREEHQQEEEGYKLAKEQYELKWQAWREETKKSYKRGTSEPAPPANSPEPPTQKRLLLTSATFEKLHEILQDNPAGVFVLRDELTGWLAELEKPGRETERSFYLEAWNGDTAFSVDRIGRGSIHVPATCVSLLGNIQPARLRSYLSDAVAGGPNDDGLFQRFQILVWPDPPSDWKLIDRPPDN